MVPRPAERAHNCVNAPTTNSTLTFPAVLTAAISVTPTRLKALAGFAPAGLSRLRLGEHAEQETAADRRRFLQPNRDLHAERKAFAILLADKRVRCLVVDPTLRPE